MKKAKSLAPEHNATKQDEEENPCVLVIDEGGDDESDRKNDEGEEEVDEASYADVATILEHFKN